MDHIPLSRPDIGPAEEAAVITALRSGAIGGGGSIGARVEALLRERTPASAVMLVQSGTFALETAFQVLQLPRGGKVILPSFTHPSSANALVRAGLRPVFAECEATTMNLDFDDVTQRIDRDVVAILVMHYGGVACAPAAFLDLCAKHGFALVEDAAHAIDARWRNRPLGTLGDAGALSFHATKNLVAGEGGALFLRDEARLQAAERFRDMGTNRSAFLRGELDRYSWVSEGSCGVLSDLAAALLEVQLQRAQEILARRRTIAARYTEALSEPCRRLGVAIPIVPDDCESNAHLYWLLYPTSDAARRALQAWNERGIAAASHFSPLHASAYAAEAYGYEREDLPRTADLAARIVRLPLSSALSDAEVARVIARFPS